MLICYDKIFTALLVYAYCNTAATHIGANQQVVPPSLQILEIAFEDFTKCCRHKALSSLRIENCMASNVAVHCDGVSSTLRDV